MNLGKQTLDLGRCLFCGECSALCHEQAILHTADCRLATRRREELILGGDELVLAAALEEDLRSLFGGSLRLREVSAAGCNACEADVNRLHTVIFDLGRFEVQFVHHRAMRTGF